MDSRDEHRQAVDALLDQLSDCRIELAQQEAQAELLISEVVNMTTEIAELRELVARLRGTR